MSVSLRQEIGSVAPERHFASGAQDLKIVLLRSLTDLFVTEQCRSPEHIERYANSFLRLAPVLDAQTRLWIATRIANIPDTPQTVIDALATGCDDAAVYVLAHGYKVPSNRLYAAAAWQSVTLATALAGRSDLDAELIRVLAERPEREILRALVANTQINFEKATLQHLVRRARSDLDTARLLASRVKDSELLAPLFMVLDADQRRLALLNLRRKHLVANQALAPNDKEQLEAIFAVAADAQRRADYVDALALAIGCSKHDAQSIAEDASGEVQAIAFAWLGALPEQCIPVFNALNPDGPGAFDRLEYLVDIVRQFPFAAADELLRKMLTSGVKERETVQPQVQQTARPTLERQPSSNQRAPMSAAGVAQAAMSRK